MDETKEKDGRRESYIPLVTEGIADEGGEEEQVMEADGREAADMALVGYEENDGAAWEETAYGAKEDALAEQYEHAMARMGDYFVPADAERFGKGGQAGVYQCLRRTQGRDSFDIVAKLYSANTNKNHLIGKIRQVNEKVKNLNNPYLAEILDHGISDDQKYYMVVMRKYEPCPKGYLELYAWRRDMEGFQKRFMREVKGLNKALGAIHEANIRHGDIKPANMMLCRDEDGEHLVLIDFGGGVIADEMSEEEIGKSAIAHAVSRGYSAPEQLLVAHPKASAYTDYYSFGLSMAELVAGLYPKEAELSNNEDKEKRLYWFDNKDYEECRCYGVILPKELPDFLRVFFKRTLYCDYNSYQENKKRWTTGKVQEWIAAVERGNREEAVRMGNDVGNVEKETGQQASAPAQPGTEVIVTYDGEPPRKIYSTEEMAEMFLKHWDETIKNLLHNQRWSERFYHLGQSVSSVFEDARKQMQDAPNEAKREEAFDSILVEFFLSDSIKKNRLRYRSLYYETPKEFARAIRAVLENDKEETGGKYRLPDKSASGDQRRNMVVKMMEMFESGTVERFFREGSWGMDKESIALAREIQENLKNAGKTPQAKAVVIADLYRLAFRLSKRSVLHAGGNEYDDYRKLLRSLKQCENESDYPFEIVDECFTKDGKLKAEFYAFVMEAPGVDEKEKPSLEDLEILP